MTRRQRPTPRLLPGLSACVQAERRHAYIGRPESGAGLVSGLLGG